MAYKFIDCPHCHGRMRSISITPQRVLYRCPTCLNTQNVPNASDEQLSRMSFLALNHQGKANLLIDALGKRYGRRDKSQSSVRFVLSDSDVLGRQQQMKRMETQGIRKFFVYPHSARPSLINDRWGWWEGTTAQIVVNEYHEEVLRGFDYPKPIIYSGWHLSPVREFIPRTVENKIKVLFAPIHPRSAPQDQAANLAVFQRLTPLVKSGDIDLTIRHIGSLEDNNIPHSDIVKYMRGEMNGSFEQIEQADIVIGHQTFPWLAVALGVPTLMMAEDMPTHFRNRGVGWMDTPSWGKVAHLFRYPLDILDTSDPLGMMVKAMESDCDIADWKRRMIGDPFNDEKFLTGMEKYL